jgi:hypothetical protein
MREGGLQERTKGGQNFWNVSGAGACALEGLCPWTVCLLKRLRRFEMAVRTVDWRGLAASTPSASEQFLYRENAEQFLHRESAAEQFLYRMSAGPGPLISAMARMELAVMRVRQGSAEEYLIEWDHNPELVFQALRAGRELPQPESAGSYRMYISRDIPGLVRCEPANAPSAQS